MKLKIRICNKKDFYAGLIFIFFGVLAMLVARSYPMGTSSRMGAGYFPIILGGILALLGLAISARGLLWLSGEPLKPWALRPLLLVSGGVLAFGFLVEPLGLVLATLTLIVMSCLGGMEFRLREVAILFLMLAALAAGIFIYAVGLPLKVWPS